MLGRELACFVLMAAFCPHSFAGRPYSPRWASTPPMDRVCRHIVVPLMILYGTIFFRRMLVL